MIALPRTVWCLTVLCLALTLGTSATAERASLFAKDTFAQSSKRLVHHGHAAAPATSASLFAGQATGTLFAPIPKRDAATPARFSPLTASATPVQRILHLISKAEAGRDGYDAVQHGARIKPAKAPTQMTIGEIYQWIKATPGQPHAIGRYQFIPATLRRLVRAKGLSTKARFSPDVQDQLAYLLLEEAGYSKAMSGQISRKRFMNNLAKIWAGLPNSTGKSHYHGYAGNKATMTWASYDAAMKRIMPN
jgi:muramidase (phage lysozyme)